MVSCFALWKSQCHSDLRTSTGWSLNWTSATELSFPGSSNISFTGQCPKSQCSVLWTSGKHQNLHHSFYWNLNYVVPVCLSIDIWSSKNINFWPHPLLLPHTSSFPTWLSIVSSVDGLNKSMNGFCAWAGSPENIVLWLPHPSWAPHTHTSTTDVNKHTKECSNK